MHYQFTPLDEEAAKQIVTWRYDAPYDLYNLQDEGALDEILAYLLDAANQFFRIDDAEGLAAYCSFGEDARVSGGDYSQTALDIGLGIRPELTGIGLGKQVIQDVLTFAAERFSPPVFRVTIAAFNQRAQKVWKHHGFVHQQTFQRPFDQLPFVILIRPTNFRADPQHPKPQPAG